MSVEAVRACLDDVTTVKGTDKLVLVVLAEAARKQGRYKWQVCWPKQRTIARRAGISESQVKRILKRLESAGLIVRHRKNDLAKTRADRTPPLYEMVFMAASRK